MSKTKIITLLLCLGWAAACTTTNKPVASLVPDKPSAAPDYFCTWNVQGFINGWEDPRTPMNEEYLFGDGLYQNWTGFFPKIREDLYFVMDDSWDIPLADKVYSPAFGTVMLDETRFPSFTGEPAERLKKLTDSVKAKGWKGLGGWICAEKSANFADVPEEEFWAARLRESAEAGFAYWKVDWGKNFTNEPWRRMLTELGREHAPDLWIEHASGAYLGDPSICWFDSYVSFSDVYRTYDVEPNVAQAVTIGRIVHTLPLSTEEGALGILNCEDEPYIAAGLGCAIGVMRHEFKGGYPNGLPDHPFHEQGRNPKARLDEIVRGVRWHRIAEPFGVGGEFELDEQKLHDTWYLREHETWVYEIYSIGDTITASAPARVSRGMALPEVADNGDDRPYVLASLYPNGAVAIAAISRTMGREIIAKEVDVTIQAADLHAPIGIFGCFDDITIEFPEAVKWNKYAVYGQDLAGDTPVNITTDVVTEGNRLTIPGDVFRRVGLMAASEGDISDPGMVLQIFR